LIFGSKKGYVSIGIKPVFVNVVETS
jgi:hypothetical protein